MIKVIVEIWPGGNEKHKRVMAVGIIANDGTGSKTRGNYQGAIGKVSQGFRAVRCFLRTVEVKGFPRTRLGVWDLLYRVLREAVGDRNP